MWILVTVVATILLAALIYLACQEGHFRVQRSLEIEAPIEAAFAAVLDLKSWPHWSPWLMHEPVADLVYSDNYQSEGGYYSWEGKVVGAGKLTHLEIRPNRSIHQQIEFLKPFKSVNQVDWEFEKLGPGEMGNERQDAIPVSFHDKAYGTDD